MAPEDHRIRDAVVPAAGAVVRVGDLRIHVLATRPTLEVEVSRAPPPPAPMSVTAGGGAGVGSP